MRAGEPTSTTQIGMMDYIQHFEPLLQAGKDILYIGFSSALSGTYNMSVLTSQELMQKYPERRIVCIDSFAASRGEGLLVYLAARKKAREDCPIEALEAWVIENRDHLCHWFTVDDLQICAEAAAYPRFRRHSVRCSISSLCCALMRKAGSVR
jgi:fatty acid-binding protein DegV